MCWQKSSANCRARFFSFSFSGGSSPQKLSVWTIGADTSIDPEKVLWSDASKGSLRRIALAFSNLSCLAAKSDCEEKAIVLLGGFAVGTPSRLPSSMGVHTHSLISDSGNEGSSLCEWPTTFCGFVLQFWKRVWLSMSEGAEVSSVSRRLIFSLEFWKSNDSLSRSQWARSFSSYSWATKSSSDDSPRYALSYSSSSSGWSSWGSLWKKALPDWNFKSMESSFDDFPWYALSYSSSLSGCSN